MEIVLYISAIVALIAVSVLVVFVIRTLTQVDGLLRESKILIHESKLHIAQISSDVTLFRQHTIPVIDDIAVVAKNIATISDGLQSKADDVYDTVDDALDVVRGAIDDVERIKDTVVATLDGPLMAVRGVSTGVFTTIFKGVGLVRDIIEGIKKKK